MQLSHNTRTMLSRLIFKLRIEGKGKPLRWDTLICTLKEIELNTLASDIQNICKLYS